MQKRNKHVQYLATDLICTGEAYPVNFGAENQSTTTNDKDNSWSTLIWEATAQWMNCGQAEYRSSFL